ncbi:MAG: Uma2 family endonuclease, partial [Chloroflexota bacterium]|nr:Uma2 family endonuclease [Chloroflexota bacterium]
MAPAGGLSSARNLELCRQLANWAQRDGRGLAFDSSAGFILPNGAMRSPDASW